MLRLYFDHNVQHQIAWGLRNRGVEVVIAYEDGMHEASDPEILSRAGTLGCAFVTKDSDFLGIAQGMPGQDEMTPGIIFITDDYLPIGQCIAELELVAKVYEDHEVRGSVLFLPLR